MVLLERDPVISKTMLLQLGCKSKCLSVMELNGQILLNIVLWMIIECKGF